MDREREGEEGAKIYQGECLFFLSFFFKDKNFGLEEECVGLKPKRELHAQVEGTVGLGVFWVWSAFEPRL